MPEVREVKNLKEATALRLEMEQRLLESLEKRREQIQGVRGVPGANADLLELEMLRHAYEATRTIEAGFQQRRQYCLTLLVASVAAFATVVYAGTYLWTVLRECI